MTAYRLIRARPSLLAAAVLIAFAGLTVLHAGRARAAFQSFGAPLTTAPTRDTANGADNPGPHPDPRYDAIAIPGGGEVHNAEDLSVWNTRLASGRASAPSGGQITTIRIRGCAIEQGGQTSYGGVDSNYLLFQSLTPDGDGTYAAGPAAGGVLLPWCSDSADPSRGTVSTHTISTYHPIHECVARGGLVAVHDIGGFVPTGGDFYANGVGLDIIGRAGGSATQSYLGYPEPAVLGPAAASGPGFGFGSESGQEVEMQLTEGTGGDAYVACPGGTGDETLESNRILCDYHPPIAPDHRECGAAARARRPPRLARLRFAATRVSTRAGLTVRYTDTRAAVTRLSARHEIFGRRRGARCVSDPTRAEHHDPVCRFWRTETVVRHHDRAGANSVHLATHGLPVGTYQLTLVATLHGRRSPTLVKTFHLVR